MKTAGLRNAGCNSGYIFIQHINIVTQTAGKVNKMAGLSPLLRLDLKIKLRTLCVMGYCKKTCKAGPVIDVVEYHTARYEPPGKERGERRKATPEEMQKANQRNKERRCWHRMLENFTFGDYFFTFTYRPEEKPENMQQAQKDYARFIRRVRERYTRNGWTLKWIRNIERGSKGAWHVHVIIKAPPGIRESDEVEGWIRRMWEHGDVTRSSRLDNRHPERGTLRHLAEYISKSGGIEPKEGTTPKETSYSTSRNLADPRTETRTYATYRTWRKIRVPKGYTLYPASLHEGINPWTGYPYREYVLVKAGFGDKVQKITGRGGRGRRL